MLNKLRFGRKIFWIITSMNVCHTEEKNVMIRTEWCLLFFSFFSKILTSFLAPMSRHRRHFLRKKINLENNSFSWSLNRSMYELQLGRSVLRHWNFCTNWFGEAIFARFSFHWHFALAWVCECGCVRVRVYVCVKIHSFAFCCYLWTLACSSLSVT